MAKQRKAVKRSTVPRRDTRARLIDVAERLCVAQGIDAVSIRDVAAAAKVSIPVIYHHFGSRAGLLDAIVSTRYGELHAEYAALLATAEAMQRPGVRDVLRIVLQPLKAWRRAGREATLQFQTLALVSTVPCIKDQIDAGVLRLRRVVDLLQRALPALTREDLCWRLHFCLKLTHQTDADLARLRLLSGGRCRAKDAQEGFERALAHAEAAFLAAPFPGRRLAKDR